MVKPVSVITRGGIFRRWFQVDPPWFWRFGASGEPLLALPLVVPLWSECAGSTSAQKRNRRISDALIRCTAQADAAAAETVAAAAAETDTDTVAAAVETDTVAAAAETDTVATTAAETDTVAATAAETRTLWPPPPETVSADAAETDPVTAAAAQTDAAWPPPSLRPTPWPP